MLPYSIKGGLMRSAAAVAILATIASPAFAKDAEPKSIAPATVEPCFDVVALPKDSDMPSVAVMVNKCTGETWSLNKMAPVDASGHIANIYYEWLPIKRALK
jgi:hypothetical protein